MFGPDTTTFVLLKSFTPKRGFASQRDRNLTPKNAKSSHPVTYRPSLKNAAVKLLKKLQR